MFKLICECGNEVEIIKNKFNKEMLFNNNSYYDQKKYKGIGLFACGYDGQLFVKCYKCGQKIEEEY